LSISGGTRALGRRHIGWAAFCGTTRSTSSPGCVRTTSRVMASVERRVRRTPEGERQLRYLVRWREADGRLRAKSFTRKLDANRFAAVVSADILRGQYVDPDAGKISFKDYATTWLHAQTFDEVTGEAV